MKKNTIATALKPKTINGRKYYIRRVSIVDNPFNKYKYRIYDENKNPIFVLTEKQNVYNYNDVESFLRRHQSHSTKIPSLDHFNKMEIGDGGELAVVMGSYRGTYIVYTTGNYKIYSVHKFKDYDEANKKFYSIVDEF